jgi:3-oxoadipate enol-lactonase
MAQINAVIDGISLHFEVHGKGEPVLFVHGFPLSGRLWDPAVALLQDRFELIVPDLRGHGRSGISEDVTMARYADDLAALLDVAGAKERVTVVGHSMGGYIAFELYRRHPERVRALVLVDTRADTDMEEAAEGRREMARRVLREDSRVIADALVDRLFAPTTSDARRGGGGRCHHPARGSASDAWGRSELAPGSRPGGGAHDAGGAIGTLRGGAPRFYRTPELIPRLRLMRPAAA